MGDFSQPARGERSLGWGDEARGEREIDGEMEKFKKSKDENEFKGV